MDKTIRRYSSLIEMKADEYRYWQSRPVWEQIDTVEELAGEAYALKGLDPAPDANVPGSQGPLVRLYAHGIRPEKTR